MQNTFRKFIISRIQRNTLGKRKIFPIESMIMQERIILITEEEKLYE